MFREGNITSKGYKCLSFLLGNRGRILRSHFFFGCYVPRGTFIDLLYKGMVISTLYGSPKKHFVSQRVNYHGTVDPAAAVLRGSFVFDATPFDANSGGA